MIKIHIMQNIALLINMQLMLKPLFILCFLLNILVISVHNLLVDYFLNHYVYLFYIVIYHQKKLFYVRYQTELQPTK